jgi:hypothetical protein
MKAIISLSLISILAGCTNSNADKNAEDVYKKDKPKRSFKASIITYKKSRSNGFLMMKSAPGSTVFFYQ